MLSKVVSVLGALVALIAAFTPFADQFDPSGVLKIVLTIGGAALAAAGGALKIPGGKVATGLGLALAVVMAVLGYAEYLPPQAATWLTVIGAVIAAVGRSLFGWEPPPTPTRR